MARMLLVARQGRAAAAVTVVWSTQRKKAFVPS